MKTIPTWWKQPSFLRFRRLYTSSNDRALFFLGSGISIQAGLPTWKGLLEELIRLSPHFSADHMPEPLGDARTYPKRASSLKKQYGDDAAWRAALDSIIDNEKKIKQPSAIHDAIAELDWHGIITTNYDALIEEAYSRKFPDREVTIARPELETELFLERETKSQFIYKIHGDIRDPHSRIVLTEEDYDAIYDKVNKTQTQAALRGVLRMSYPILFAGYSHDDEMMMRFYRDAMEYTPRGSTFALVPVEGSHVQVESKVSRLSSEFDINFIAYSPEDNHRELVEFFKYLSDPITNDAIYNSLLHAKRPTIVLVHCGGTIGSADVEDEIVPDGNPLRVSTVSSRFAPKLHQLSEKLVEWYQESYNLGSRVAIDVQWEILPEKYQMFSENATPELWNAVVEKIDKVTFKYFEAAKHLQHGTHLEMFDRESHSSEYQKVLQLYQEEQEEYRRVFPDRDLSSRQFISGFQSRYVLGIVLLFGTDTMSYLASALSFGLQHMPCAIVVTGSNQPPDNSIVGRVPFFNNSDAWKNILLSFYFLQSFGHTLTDAFISFGDTIHHGVNVRKIASEMGPASAHLANDVEPFVFRNLHIHGQYMFRLIDGVFCNNYYTSERIPYSSLVGTQGENFLDLRHIRRDPLQRRQDAKQLIRGDFGENRTVCHVVATPCTPMYDVARMCAPESGSPLRVVLVEGYASGTYPTVSASNFSTFLLDLYHHGIPIFLISQYGIPEKQRKYDVMSIQDVSIPVHTWHGVTIEPALPILSLVARNISDDEWGYLAEAGTAKGDIPEFQTLDELINHRIRLINRHMKQFFRERPNILTLEIDPSEINKQERSVPLNKARENIGKADYQRTDKINDRGHVSLKGFHSLTDQLKSKYVLLYPHDFTVLVNEVVRRDERKGCGPDGFAALSDMGFDYGLALVQAIAKSMDLKFGFGFVPFSRRDPKEQDALLSAALDVIDTTAELLRATNVANITIEDIGLPEIGVLESESSPEQVLAFTITSHRIEEPEYSDEKYTAVSFSEEDSLFFERLAAGCADEQSLDRHYRELETAYDQILRNKWRHRTSSLDWLLLGVYKGVICGLAQFLRFDDLSIDARRMTNHSGYRYVFRKAAHCTVLAADEQVFRIRLSYCKSRPAVATSDV